MLAGEEGIAGVGIAAVAIFDEIGASVQFVEKSQGFRTKFLGTLAVDANALEAVQVASGRREGQGLIAKDFNDVTAEFEIAAQLAVVVLIKVADVWYIYQPRARPRKGPWNMMVPSALSWAGPSRRRVGSVSKFSAARATWSIQRKW